MVNHIPKPIKYLILLVLSGALWVFFYDIGAALLGSIGPGGSSSPLWYTILLTATTLTIFINACIKASKQ
jgi:polyferredoxin